MIRIHTPLFVIRDRRTGATASGTPYRPRITSSLTTLQPPPLPPRHQLAPLHALLDPRGAEGRAAIAIALATRVPSTETYHDVLLLIGVIGRLLRTEQWMDGQGRWHQPLLNRDELQLLIKVYATPGGTTRHLAIEQSQKLIAVEGRLARAMLQAGVIRADQLLDGLAEVRKYLGVDAKTLRHLLLRYPMRRIPGKRMQTLIPWINEWIDDLPRQWRRNWRRWGRLKEAPA